MTMLINLLVLCILIAVLYWIATLFSPMLPRPLERLPFLIVAILALLLLLNVLGVGQPVFHIR